MKARNSINPSKSKVILSLIVTFALLTANSSVLYASDYSEKTESNYFNKVTSKKLDTVIRSGTVSLEPLKHTNRGPLINIRQVVIDWDNNQILIGLDAVQGEVYTLKFSQEDTGIMQDQEWFVQDGKSILNLEMILKKDLKYTLALYDYYNSNHSTFTWRQPFDFEAYRFNSTTDFIDVTPQALPRTSDLDYIYTPIIGLIVSIGFLNILRLKRGDL